MTSTLKLYAIIGLVLAALAGIGVVYAKGRIDSNHAAQLQDAQHKVDAANAQIAQVKKDLAAAERAAQLDQLQALQDAKDKDQRNAFVSSQVPLLADPARSCFDGIDGDRVRNIFAPYPLASPPPEGAGPARH
ncbi:MAG: hypothetical protein EOR11_20055 [Mesorhizobium sp.]|uniref:hypothetical protein n=1 Tax=Mesorhizobium sp. TaxID=1871066 RepID=UPI000FE54F82|nr:hypothetical protein [Mesorhizobium sp.]RWP84756.1 MAG: hypothetical protein EOR11_20055 [Mesorhizobium sp.]